METQGVFRVRQKESSFQESVEEQRAQETKMKPTTMGKEAEEYNIIFWALVGLSQVAGLFCVAFVVWWCMLNGGFDWNDDELLFLFHPLMMVLGLIFFFGDAILVYRALYFLPKWLLKYIHGSLHFVAILLSSIGIAAVFENHRRTNKPDMYSLHSWIGIGTFSTFCLQYIGAFTAFLYPGLPGHMRARIMPFHTFFGLGIFALAVATALMGCTEKLLWTDGYSSGAKSGIVGNVLGLFMVIFAFLVFYISTRSNYKRQPRQSDTAAIQ